MSAIKMPKRSNFKMDNPKAAEAKKESLKTATEIEAEGCVLLMNTGKGGLPLEKKKINVFGVGAASPYFGGGGSGYIDLLTVTGFFKALKEGGIEYNPKLYNLYKNWSLKGKKSVSAFPEEGSEDYPKVKATDRISGTLGGIMKQQSLSELPAKALSPRIMNNAKKYSDTAIVFISRTASEQRDVTVGNLKITDDEKKMLAKVCSYMKNVILVLNTGNPMELGFISEYKQIKSLLLIGMPGEGMQGAVDVISGKVSPSGRLCDTYYYSLKDSSAVANVGDFTYNDSKNKFMLYKEGIYVGYRYAETFFTGDEYNQKVQFPFGYGLSYASFTWSEGKLTAKDNEISITLKVKNTGKTAGKDVVEVYMKAPYDGNVEKAERVLVAFEKTEILAPGKSQNISFDIPKKMLSSYDEKTGAYEACSGKYEFCISHNVHEPAISLTYELNDCITFENDEITGNKIKNRFPDAHSYTKILSRKDNPLTVLVPPTEDEKTEPAQVKENDKKEIPVIGGADFVQGQFVSLKLEDLKGVDTDDEKWNTFLNQFTIKEMIAMVVNGGYEIIENKRMGIPYTECSDGPAKVGNMSTVNVSGTGFPVDTVLACTWNTSLAREKGDRMAKEALILDTACIYAPAVNTHRSPIGGRNFEYFSEDPLLAGKMAASEINGMQNMGLAAFTKHFALNDQETNRIKNAHIWCSEQAMREIYLRPFEIAVKEGKSLGIMSSYNSAGAPWCGECKALLVDILREEWGFKGCVVTDAALTKAMATSTGISAGNDLWLTMLKYGEIMYTKQLKAAYKKDKNGTTAALRRAVKGMCYMVVNSNRFFEK